MTAVARFNTRSLTIVCLLLLEFWTRNSLGQNGTTTVAPPCILPTILHGTFQRRGVVVPAGMPVHQGGVIQLSCDDGFYVTHGAKRVACVEDGWEPDIGICSPIPDDFSECGRRSDYFEDNPNGEVQPGEFPWLARLDVDFSGTVGREVCGASLIARQWLLTAAHCVTKGRVNGISVEIGGAKYSVFDDLNQRNSSVPSAVIIHPSFVRLPSGAYAYDFAIIKLSSAVTLSENLRTICLPSVPVDLCKESDDISRSSRRESCKLFYTAGFGSLEVSIPLTSPTPHKMAIDITSTSGCSGVPSNVSDFCANSRSSSSSSGGCWASPGSPLMCQRSGHDYLVGVFSNNPSGHCGDAANGQSDVFGRVCDVTWWIRLTIGDVLPTTTIRHREFTTRPKTTTTVPPQFFWTKPWWWMGMTTTPLRRLQFMMELGEAAASGDRARLRELLNRGANPDGVGYPSSYYPAHCDYEWRWPNATALLWVAACNRSPLLLADLLERGACVNSRDGFGMNAVLAAAYHGNTDSVVVLLSHGAKVNVMNNAGDTPLMEASFFGYDETVKLLIENGANVNAKNADGQSALMQAAANNRVTTARILLDNGANINEEDIDGYSALTKAVINGFLDMVLLLIEQGADLDAKTDAGLTALNYAEKAGRTDIMLLLLDRHASREGCHHELCRTCTDCKAFARP